MSTRKEIPNCASGRTRDRRAIVASSIGHAEGAKPHGWVVRGVGNDSCGKFVAALEDSPPGRGAIEWQGATYYGMREVYAEWIQGFVTAANLQSDHRSKQISVDYPGTELWIRKWCDMRPAQTVIDAASAFIRDQKGK
jgi:hypothetical protein